MDADNAVRAVGAGAHSGGAQPPPAPPSHNSGSSLQPPQAPPSNVSPPSHPPQPASTQPKRRGRPPKHCASATKCSTVAASARPPAHVGVHASTGVTATKHTRASAALAKRTTSSFNPCATPPMHMATTAATSDLGHPHTSREVHSPDKSATYTPGAHVLTRGLGQAAPHTSSPAPGKIHSSAAVAAHAPPAPTAIRRPHDASGGRRRPAPSRRVRGAAVIARAPSAPPVSHAAATGPGLQEGGTAFEPPASVQDAATASPVPPAKKQKLGAIEAVRAAQGQDHGQAQDHGRIQPPEGQQQQQQQQQQLGSGSGSFDKEWGSGPSSRSSSRAGMMRKATTCRVGSNSSSSTSSGSTSCTKVLVPFS
mmetsp:Transcript_11459/g.29874  ORF Transcript_11459/g.29874 Transcript_11459/m.29874 type:complete len:366 (-) Transcript_11459:688-1785(-)